MFSHNHKISERQMRRMLVLFVYAQGIFTLPYLSARMFGQSAFLGLAVFIVFASLYTGSIYAINRGFVGMDAGGFVTAMQKCGGIGRAILLLQVLRMLLRLVFFILLGLAILREGQVPFMGETAEPNILNLLVLAPLLLVAWYGASRSGIEKQGRICELVFWVLFIPFIVVVFFGLWEVDYHVFIPRLSRSLFSLFGYGYVLLVLVVPVEYYLYIRPQLAELEAGKKKDGKRTFITIIATYVLLSLLSLFVIGIFGVNHAENEVMLTISIMRYIQLPFGVLERFDVLMVWFFMTGCFVLICETLYFSNHLLSAVFTRGVYKWPIPILLGVAIVIAAFLPAYQYVLPAYLFYGAIFDVPLSLLIPILGGVLTTYRCEQEVVEDV